MEDDKIIIVKDLTGRVNNLEKDIDDAYSNNDDETMAFVEEEIKEIEESINRIEEDNKKNASVKNVRIFKNIFKLLLPFLIPLLVLLGFFRLAGDIPFVRQDNKVPMHYEETIDSNGKHEIKNWYEREQGTTSSLDYYYKWTKEEDGLYYRKVYHYYTKNKTLEELAPYVNDAALLKKTFSYNSSGKEIETTVPEEDLEKDYYIKATVRRDDYSDYIMEPQSEMENILASIAFVVFLAIFSGCSYTLWNLKEPGLKGLIDNIKNNNSQIDIDDIKKQFSRQRKEYEKLKGIKPVDVQDILDKDNKKRTI